LNRALQLKPDSLDTLYLLAQVLARESRPMDALALLVRAHKIAPENADVILLMARSAFPSTILRMRSHFLNPALPLLRNALISMLPWARAIW